ncbi:MAG: DUF2087 domain-containing protein [bacterium]|nr:DUF2087 domain-containing protein [bacterium]
MDYKEGVVKDTEFFTTSELAQKLKMNVQVITRKIQAGEIRAYKIGKDWRIPEKSVYTWLEQQANDSKSKTSVTRIKSVRRPEKPAKADQGTSQRKFLLEYILAQFEPGREYAEPEMDRIVERYHHDFRTVRRELVTEKMMEPTDSGYRRRAGYRLTSVK